MSDQNPVAGWYPAPHANNEQRYWDGTQWLEAQPPAGPADATDAPTEVLSSGDAPTTVLPADGAAAPQAAGATPPPYVPVTPPPFDGTVASAAAPAAPQKSKKPKKRVLLIGASVVAGLIIVSGIANAVNGGGDDAPTADDKPAAVSEASTTVVEEAEEEPAVVMVTVPDVTGMTATEALLTLATAGLNPPVITTLADPLAKVLSTAPAAGAQVEEGADVTLTLEEKPAFTIGQQNAIGSAKNYLSFTGFSRTGLIGQLEFEGFSTEDATFAVDNAGADWNAEAAEKAQSYLEYSSFSRQGLYDQMAFEGFLPAEIEFALAAVGY